MFRSEVDLYRTADGRIVAAGDPDAAFLIVNAGREIADGELALLGVDVRDVKALAKGLGDASSHRQEPDETEPDEGKKAEEKAEDKAAAKSENKGR
jgi:hypothetical protein